MKKTRAFYIEDEIYGGFEATQKEIIVPEHINYDTGLLDQHGNRITRQPRPIGFGRWT